MREEIRVKSKEGKNAERRRAARFNRAHRKMLLWRRAMNLAEETYKATKNFPKEERFGIVQQMKRSVLSILSNVAEGAARSTDREKIRFFVMARGSLSELEAQMELSRRLKFSLDGHQVFALADEVGGLLGGLIQRFRKQTRTLALLFTLFTLYSLLFTSFSFAARKGVGTTGGQFLKIAPGAREAAMGEAQTGLADSVNAIYYNPAGTAFLENRELTAQYTRWFQAFNYEWAALALPFKKAGTFGVGLANLNVSGIERRGTTDTDEKTGTFGASDFAYTFHYARKFHQRVGAGVNLKYVRVGIDTLSAGAFAVDLGVLAHLYKGEKATVGLGVAVKDWGSRLKFGVSAPTGDKLPTLYKAGLGLGWHPKNKTDIALDLDLHIPIDNRVLVAFGGELKHRFMSDFGLAVRAGFKMGGDVDGLKGISLGGGVSWKKLGFDFGWVPFGDLGSTYRFSLLIKF